MTRLKQYMMRPTPTKQMRAICSLQRVPPKPVEPFRPGMSACGRDMLLYHDIVEGAAQGMMEVKKLSKDRPKAADHAHINTTSTSVCASLAEVRQRPSGRPKYSSCYMMTKRCIVSNYSTERLV